MTDEAGLDDDEPLTQYVFARHPPQEHPRPRGQDGLSLLRGALTTNEAAGYVRRHVHSAHPGDAVRYTTAGALRAAGFTVVAPPSRRIPTHVSVSRNAEWNDQACADFNGCFTEVSDTQEGW